MTATKEVVQATMESKGTVNVKAPLVSPEDQVILRLGHGITGFLNKSLIEGQEDQKYLKVSRYLGDGNDGRPVYKSINLSKEQVEAIIANEKIVEWLD
jgi:hypothetical protein